MFRITAYAELPAATALWMGISIPYLLDTFA